MLLWRAFVRCKIKDVLFQVDTLRELILTHVASEWLLHLVHALVGSQVGGGGESLLAICTSKRFEVGVD